MNRGGVRVRGGGFAAGRIGTRIRKTYFNKTETTKSATTNTLQYRKPTIFQNTNVNNIQTTQFNQQQQPQQQQPQPQKSGLKLVLKRASGNAYKVKAIDTNRPKREAAQKVRFVFSENEDDDSSPTKTSFITTTKQHYDYEYRSETTEIDSDDDDNDNHYRVHKTSSRIAHHLTNNNITSNQQIRPAKIQKAQRTSQTKQSKDDDDIIYLEEIKVINFDEDEVVPQTIEEKMLIAGNQPYVKANHSKPFAIALVEERTNVVYSKALLLNHLYQSYSSPCILCPLCRKFLSVPEFSKHLHSNMNELNDENNNKSFNILPYRTKTQVTECDMKTWKAFGKRYTEFKKQRLLKRELQRSNPNMKISQSGLKLSSNSNNNKENSLSSNKENNDYLKSIKSLNWNYVSKDKSTFLINKTLLENDQIVNISLDDNTKNTQNNNNNIINKDTNVKGEDLVLSEEEDEDEEMKEVEVEETKMDDKDKNDEVDSKINHEIEDIDMNNVENELSNNEEKLFNFDKTIPSIKNRYFNFYDNLNYELLMFICDNGYTVIPNTYIDYIYHKFEKQIRNANICALTLA